MSQAKINQPTNSNENRSRVARVGKSAEPRTKTRERIQRQHEGEQESHLSTFGQIGLQRQVESTPPNPLPVADHTTLRPTTTLFQPTLEVGAPDDAYELEAERTADAVMRMPSGDLTGWGRTAPTPPQLQLKCAACSGEEEVMRSAENATPTITPEIEYNIQRLQNGGQPLADDTRTFFEQRMGADFSNVRIHTDANAIQTSRDIHARAFTVGNNIAFNSGEYSPDTSAGKHLLAHELTHTIQQSGATQRVATLHKATVQKQDEDAPASASDRDVNEVIAYIHGEMTTNAAGDDVAYIREKLDTSLSEGVLTVLSPWLAGMMGEDPISETYSAYQRWYTLVRTGGIWDHKATIRGTFGDWTIDQPMNLRYFYDIWSNIHYGYIGLACGFSEWVLLAGAGAAQIMAGTVPSGYWSRRFEELGDADFMAAFDDPKDQAAIRVGFDLWKQGGTGISTQDILNAVRAYTGQLSTQQVDGE